MYCTGSQRWVNVVIWVVFLSVTLFTPPYSHAAEVEDGSFAEEDW